MWILLMTKREEKTKLATATERIYELQDLLSESHARKLVAPFERLTLLMIHRHHRREREE
jgi:hypothetical protein